MRARMPRRSDGPVAPPQAVRREGARTVDVDRVAAALDAACRTRAPADDLQPLLDDRAIAQFAWLEGLALADIARIVGRSPRRVSRLLGLERQREPQPEPAPLARALPGPAGPVLRAPVARWHGAARLAPEAFRRWFGASVMVTDDGAPAILYHATTAPEHFSAFDRTEDIGYHAGSRQSATHRLATLLRDPAPSAGEAGGRLMPLYVRITRPLLLPDCHTWALKNVLSAIEAQVPVPEPLLEIIDGWDLFTEREMHTLLTTLGFDGALYRNETEGGGWSCFVTDPRHVKAAYGNAGTFDPLSPALDD